MRHKVAGRGLGRSSSHRRALYRNLVADLLDYEKITTTEAKAKEVRSLVERVITLGKEGGLSSRRQALAFIFDKKVVSVGFRAFTQEQAELLGVTGYVRNLTDGRVEALAEGRHAVLAEMMRRLEAGPSAAEVQSMETEDLPSSGEYETFTIRY
jgi:ribosomal protein L17